MLKGKSILQLNPFFGFCSQDEKVFKTTLLSADMPEA